MPVISVRCAAVTLSSGARLTAGLAARRFVRGVRGFFDSFRTVPMVTVSLVLSRTTTSTVIFVSRTVFAIGRLVSRRIRGLFHSRGAMPMVVMSFALLRAWAWGSRLGASLSGLSFHRRLFAAVRQLAVP
jgi:hypothetical protein